MTVNVGTVDHAVRIIAGLALIALAFTGTIGVWGYIGILPVLSGLFRVCRVFADRREHIQDLQGVMPWKAVSHRACPAVRLRFKVRFDHAAVPDLITDEK